MVKRIRYQEQRIRGRRRTEPRERWVFEPMDAVLLAIMFLVTLWLQWLTTQLSL